MMYVPAKVYFLLSLCSCRSLVINDQNCKRSCTLLMALILSKKSVCLINYGLGLFKIHAYGRFCY